MKVQWTPDLATGSSEIDTQHVELFKRIDGLMTAFDEGIVDREQVGKVIQFLDDYVVFHFGTEEKHMTRFAYANKSAHTAQHEQFVRNFGKIRERMVRDGVSPELAEDTKQLCVDWLVNHIKFSDKALGMFLKQKMR
jgi:hemerythrin